MAIRFKLAELIEEHKNAGVTKNALAREAKVRPNLVYELCSGKTRRIDIETLNTLLNTLNDMTGKQFLIQDVLQYLPDK